jgi:predicted DNA-binding transcriptional regulator AlpA
VEKLLTVRMVAEALHLHENSVYRYIQEHVFPRATKIRRGWYIPQPDVQRVLRNGRTR